MKLRGLRGGSALTADVSSQIKVAVSDKFMVALTQLPKSQQRKTMEFVSAFRQNPKSPGLNYENKKIRGFAISICSD